MTDAIRFEVVDAASPSAVAAMRRYAAELAGRFGLDASSLGHEGPFVVALDGAAVVAGGGLRTLRDGSAEVKRMWVDPERRGIGLGRRLLARLEALARDSGHDLVRLDTKAALVQAVALYDSSGYRRIGRYNDNPEAELFFEKALRPSA